MQVTLLVPTDFTEVAHTAIQHAIRLGETINAEVVLLNVVKETNEISGATKKMEKEEEIARSFGTTVSIRSSIRVGNIFDDIGHVASELGASLIIMGTHGKSGWQKVTGSYALKVITNSNVPFVVVQKQNMKPSGYDQIIVPLDFSIETKQKMELVSDMALYFNSEVHLITPYESDEFLRHKLNGNIAWSKKYLARKKVKCATHVSKKGANFVKEILLLASETNADLISIMSHKNTIGLFGSNYEQSLITNELQIPILCVNPLSSTIASRSIFVR